MNQADLPFELEHLSKPTPNFEYDILDAETQMVVQQRTNEVKTLMRRTSQDVIAIGQKLIEVKQHLGHGNFINWLKSEFNWSVSTATKFMQVGEQFKFINFTNLNITASYYLVKYLLQIQSEGLCCKKILSRNSPQLLIAAFRI